MKSTPTPWTHTAVTTEEITTQFGPSGSVFKRTATVPAGTRCHFLENSHWVVSDLSFIKDKHSIDYHDADHYGISIDPSKLDQIVDVSKPYFERKTIFNIPGQANIKVEIYDPRATTPLNKGFFATKDGVPTPFTEMEPEESAAVKSWLCARYPALSELWTEKSMHGDRENIEFMTRPSAMKRQTP